MGDPQDLFMEAHYHLTGDRQEQYGPAPVTLSRVADVWSAILDAPVEAEDVALCLTALKLVREARRHDPDNVVDAVGYLGALWQIHDTRGS